MRISFLFLLMFQISYAQINVKDSASNGEYHIRGGERLDVLVESQLRKDSISQEKRKNPCEEKQMIMGYRIQLLSTKKRHQADDTIIAFNFENKEYKAELAYTSPDFRVLLLGAYAQKEDVQKLIREFRSKYPTAMAVQWRVPCREVMKPSILSNVKQNL